MYENILKANLGKVVSVKTTAGIELIATLTGYDEKKFTLTLDKPRLVVITEDEVAVVPQPQPQSNTLESRSIN